MRRSCQAGCSPSESTGACKRAHALDAQVGREHVAVAAAGAVPGLGERDEQLAMRRLAVHGQHVAVAEPQRVAHDRVRVAREVRRRPRAHASGNDPYASPR